MMLTASHLINDVNSLIDLNSTKGGYQKWGRTGRTSACGAYCLGWSGCIVLAKSQMLFTTGLVWPASSDKQR